MRGKEAPADSDEEEGKTLLEMEEELSAAKKKQVLLGYTALVRVYSKTGLPPYPPRLLEAWKLNFWIAW